ncbi:hypothetical protein [Nitrosomonas sp.]|uniref:hypothetical protein n=1 Tax=Nitrosomonas sp. TaxID=42353 RepID=UPI0025DA7518|nr:hypothetical protein [Nitrosomonas sp.]
MCSITAAIKYEIPANILLAIAEKEGGKSGQWVRNSNGTHDVGSLQFNTAYLQDLSRYGITAAMWHRPVVMPTIWPLARVSAYPKRPG